MAPPSRLIAGPRNAVSCICDTILPHPLSSSVRLFPIPRRVYSSLNRTSSSRSTTSYLPRPKYRCRNKSWRRTSASSSRPLAHVTALRSYSSNAGSHSSIPQPAEAGLVPLRHRRLVSLSGADTPKFLQGLITNNVDPKSYRPFYSACLDARGRMLWDIFVWPQESETKEWGCLIEVEASETDGLLRHLKRHKLRSKIVIKVVEDDGEEAVTVWAGWGPELAESLPRPGSSIIAYIPDPRAGNLADVPPFAHRLLVKGNELPSGLSAPVLDPEQYRLRRYLYGVPEGPSEIPRENALPMENNVDLAGGIDFRKGCYVGQELTIRTKHTGVVRKRILPVQLYRAEEPVPGSSEPIEKDHKFPQYNPSWQAGEASVEVPCDIKQLKEDGGLSRSRGKLMAHMGNVGLAMCRLEYMTPMTVSAEGGSYTPDAQFALQSSTSGENPVRVKAFLPYWLVAREREVWDKSRSKRNADAE